MVTDRELRLTGGKTITFNDEQFEGVTKIKSWLKNPKSNFFTLAGYAGTGKSTIVKKIIDEYRGGVCVSATTHKAKKVIMNTTGRDGKTLHSLLGLRPDVSLDDFNPNQPQFNPIAFAKICDYNLNIIDEVSQINLELFKLITDKVEGRRTKVLYVGDPAQIPPVGEKASAVFDFITNDFHQLTKVERQTNGNPLALTYDLLRNNLNSIDGGFKRITDINERGEGILFSVDKRWFRRAILEKYSSDEYKKDTDYCKVIAWKNDTIIAANEVIRGELFGYQTDIIEVGDILMGYRTVTNDQQNYNIVENSADYRVMEKSALEENEYHIKGFKIKIREELAHGEFKFDDIFVVDSSDHANLHLYAQMHDFFRDMGKLNKKDWRKYYAFRRGNFIMKTIDKYQNGLYRRSEDTISKDLDYGYAITAHKSQGSTYTHTFVMENDIYENWSEKERNQILYVALTRPTTSATVLTNRLD